MYRTIIVLLGIKNQSLVIKNSLYTLRLKISEYMYNTVFVNTEICSIFNLNHSTVKIYQYLKFSYLSDNLIVPTACDILGTESKVALKTWSQEIFEIAELHRNTDTHIHIIKYWIFSDQLLNFLNCLLNKNYWICD